MFQHADTSGDEPRRDETLTGRAPRIEVWTCAVVPRAHRNLSLVAMLDGNERAFLAGLTHQGAAEQFVTAHALLREALASVAGIDKDSPRFERLDSGRWCATLPDSIGRFAFSVAHTERGVAAAVAECGELGIDLEPISRLNQRAERGLDARLTAVLAASERTRLSTMEAAERDAATLEIWTLKEAISKLLGVGHALDFAGIEISTGALPTVAGLAPDQKKTAVFLMSKLIEVGSHDLRVSLAFRDERSSQNTSPQIIFRMMQF